MKPKSINGLLLSAFILLMTGCTIEKRLFQPGYCIEWKKKSPKKDIVEITNCKFENKKEPDSIPNTNLDSDFTLETEKTDQETLPTSAFTERPEKPIALTKNPNITLSNDPGNQQSSPNSPQDKKADKSSETETRKEFELFGIMSFGLYFNSLLFVILTIVAFHSIYGLVAAGFMLLLSLIFGIISVDKYRRNKSKYRRNFFGYFGLIASVVTISMTIFLLLIAYGLDSF